ncbi:MAG: cytochrome c biogenesis protein CcsA [Desulfovibrionales bacterium]
MTLGIAAIVLMITAQYFIYVYAPLEETMGAVQKIFYSHLPLAWWALASFFVVFASSIVYLLRRESKWDLLAGGAAELGVLMSGLALVTGSVWARAAWNTWWTWDPRLSTTLIMWFVYSGYLVQRMTGSNREQRAMISAVIGIVAFIDVPLVFYSARLWRSIHPAVFASQGGGLEPEMWVAVFVSLAAWGMLWVLLLRIRVRQLRAGERIDTAMTEM